jgi:hypothetical protein
VNIPKDAEHPWTIFSRKMTPVFTSGPSVAALHPKFDTWEFAVTITYDSKRIPKTKVLDIIREAGRSEGLGAYRIDGFGRFGVTK